MAGIGYEALNAHAETPLTRALRWPGASNDHTPATDEMCEVAIVAMNAALHGLPVKPRRLGAKERHDLSPSIKAGEEKLLSVGMKRLPDSPLSHTIEKDDRRAPFWGSLSDEQNKPLTSSFPGGQAVILQYILGESYFMGLAFMWTCLSPALILSACEAAKIYKTHGYWIYAPARAPLPSP